MAGSIVEHLDVIEDIRFGHITSFIDPFLDVLLLQAAEEGFGYSVVPAITPSTHARFQIVGFAEA